MIEYYEMRVAFAGPTSKMEKFRHLIESSKWQYSSISMENDVIQRHATRKMNAFTPVHEVTQLVKDMASHLDRHGATILRRWVGKVIFDDDLSFIKIG